MTQISGFDGIYSQIYDVTGVTPRDINGKGKIESITDARAAFVILCRDLPTHVAFHIQPSFPEIGTAMGSRCHTTCFTCYHRGKNDEDVMKIVKLVCWNLDVRYDDTRAILRSGK